MGGCQSLDQSHRWSLSVREGKQDTHNRLHAVQGLPVGDAARLEVDEAIIDGAARGNDDNVCYSGGSRRAHWVGQPGLHFLLARLVQRDDVEEDIAMRLLDDGDGGLDLVVGERVERVWERHDGGAEGWRQGERWSEAGTVGRRRWGIVESHISGWRPEIPTNVRPIKAMRSAGLHVVE